MCLIAVNMAVLNVCPRVIILKYQLQNMHTIINVPSLLVSSVSSCQSPFYHNSIPLTKQHTSTSSVSSCQSPFYHYSIPLTRQHISTSSVSTFTAYYLIQHLGGCQGRKLCVVNILLILYLYMTLVTITLLLHVRLISSLQM
jgi:hypothetical protein